MTAARDVAAGGGVTATDALRLAAEHHPPSGGISYELQRRIDAFTAEHPEVTEIHRGDFGVLHATVAEGDGTRYIAAHTLDGEQGLLAKVLGRLAGDGGEAKGPAG